MTDNPLVSIIIPVYNGSNFLAKAIDSALAQTYSNIEIIVINDGSQDNGKTEELALAYGNKIRYYYKENGGVSSALNLGIQVMKGDYFSWLSHDDEYLPDKVEYQINILKKHNDPDLIALCGDRQINSNSDYLDMKSKCWFKDGAIISWRDSVMTLLNTGTFNGCAMLIPKHIFDECGNFDTTMRYNQDAQMWFDIFLSRKQLVYQANVLVLNRVHGAQVTQTRKELYHSDCEKMSETLLPRLIEASDENYHFLNAYALYNAKYDNRAVVERCLQLKATSCLLSRGQRTKIRCVAIYGRIRPTIRKIYYLFFKRVAVKTK